MKGKWLEVTKIKSGGFPSCHTKSKSSQSIKIRECTNEGCNVKLQCGFYLKGMMESDV